MKFEEGDLVRVVCNITEDGLIGMDIGTEAKIVAIWEGEEYPIELEGYGECLKEEEIELVEV